MTGFPEFLGRGRNLQKDAVTPRVPTLDFLYKGSQSILGMGVHIRVFVLNLCLLVS